MRAAVETGNVRLRASLAFTLEPKGPAPIELLRALAGDANATIRAHARKLLAGVDEVPWWQGKFSRDPLAMLAPREQRSAGPALAALNEALDDDARDEREGGTASALAKGAKSGDGWGGDEDEEGDPDE